MGLGKEETWCFNSGSFYKTSGSLRSTQEIQLTSVIFLNKFKGEIQPIKSKLTTSLIFTDNSCKKEVYYIMFYTFNISLKCFSWNTFEDMFYIWRHKFEVFFLYLEMQCTNVMSMHKRTIWTSNKW